MEIALGVPDAGGEGVARGQRRRAPADIGRPFAAQLGDTIGDGLGRDLASRAAMPGSTVSACASAGVVGGAASGAMASGLSSARPMPWLGSASSSAGRPRWAAPGAVAGYRHRGSWRPGSPRPRRPRPGHPQSSRPCRRCRHPAAWPECPRRPPDPAGPRRRSPRRVPVLRRRSRRGPSRGAQAGPRPEAVRGPGGELWAEARRVGCVRGAPAAGRAPVRVRTTKTVASRIVNCLGSRAVTWFPFRGCFHSQWRKTRYPGSTDCHSEGGGGGS